MTSKKQQTEDFAALVAEKFLRSGIPYTCSAVYRSHVESYAYGLCELDKRGISPRTVMNKGEKMLLDHCNV